MRYVAISTKDAGNYRNGGMDANGQLPERTVSDGDGNPCRHCLQDIPAGREMLVLSHRPFPAKQPYAEQGPVFLCADTCTRRPASKEAPPLFNPAKDYIIRGYDKAHRIRSGTGRVVNMKRMDMAVADLLEDPQTEYVHIRSSSNNCFLCRAER